MSLEKNIRFQRVTDYSCDVINRQGITLGMIKQQRVVFHMHWCFIPATTKRFGDLYFTGRTLREIQEKISEMYRQKKFLRDDVK